MPTPKPITLAQLLDLYQESAHYRGKESTTKSTEKTHLGHFRRLLPLATPVMGLANADLQNFIEQRREEDGIRGGKVRSDTIKKEVETLRVIWNQFGRSQKIVTAPFIDHFGKLVYPKRQIKPPFQTYDQIEKKIARGSLSSQKQLELWDCLFLDQEQVQGVLKIVGMSPVAPPWLYPMFVFAAHTGARRSEIIRSELDDFDFSNRVVHLREKKRDHETEFTFRPVALSPLLIETMQDWFGRHPGGQFTICEEDRQAITPKASVYHYREVLENTKWRVCRGWHLFRHSLASIMASQGIDQRLIDATLGHQTEEMRCRYRHLFPGKQREALASVFS